MITRHGFLYTPPMLGYSPFVSIQPPVLGQAQAPRPLTVDVHPSPEAQAALQENKSSISLLGLILVAGAITVALEVGGVISIYGLDRLQLYHPKKKKPSKTCCPCK